MLKDKIQAELMKCKSLQEMIAMLTAAVGVEPTTATQADTPPDNSEYGLKARGNKAREEINKQCKEILNAVTESADLTPEQRDVLLQYSGRGGLAEGSQYEYYTPTVIAEGLWDAVKANGFENGNVLDPCCGAGVFCGTKPAGVVMTATDIDETGAGVAGLLNPTDSVSNVPFETLAVNTPDNTFDSAIGNVPFGNVRGASAHLDPQYKDVKQLEFYFILRAIDKVKNGGLVAFISSPTAIDNKQKTFVKYRTMVSKKAEFLGAHRLPAGVFHNQGTDTVTDILFFRKHPQDVLEKIENGDYTLETLQAANVVWDEFVTGGKYFKGEGKKFVYGTITKVKNRFGDMVETVVNGDQNGDGKLDNAALAKKLAIKFKSRIDWDLLNSTEPVVRNYVEGDTRFINGAQYKFENGDWVKVDATSDEAKLDKNLFGLTSTAQIEAIVDDPLLALDLTPEQIERIASVTSLPDGILKAAACANQSRIAGVRLRLFRAALIGSQLEKLEEDERQGDDVSLRKAKLQEMVASEIQKYGHPDTDKHMQALSGEGTRQFYIFKQSIDAKTGEFKGALSDKKIDKGNAAVDTNNAVDVVNYLFLLKDVPVTMEAFKDLYTGDGFTKLTDFCPVDDIAITPDGKLVPMTHFLTGEVVATIEWLEDAVKDETDKDLIGKFNKEIELLNGKKKHTSLDKLHVSLNSPWLPVQYVLDFFESRGEDYYKRLDEPDEEGNMWGSEGILTGFNQQLLNYLNGAKISGAKAEQIEFNMNMLEQYELDFNEFLRAHPDREKIEKLYNEKYNSFVKAEYSDSDLGISDITSGDIIPHGYQNQEVRRLTDIGCGICGFGVGLGKTTTALALTANLYKKGKFKRTALIVPDAVLENWYHESNKFYNPEYFKNNVKVVGIEPVLDKDGNVQTVPVRDENGEQIVRDGKPQTKHAVKSVKGAKLTKILWDIVDNPNISLIVMSKETFSKIPLSPENVQKYAGEMVARNDNGKEGYEGAKRKELLARQFSDEGREKNRTDYPLLDVDLKIDSIITDESHNYKNNMDVTGSEQAQGVKYLSTAPASQLGKDMLMKAEYIRRQNGGKGVFGLSATPVTNSPIEIFNMLSLVMPYDEWERRDISNVDDFLKQFIAIAMDDCMNAICETKKARVLKGFENLDGLRGIFQKYVNIVSAKDVSSTIHVPEAIEVEEEVELSPEQQAAYEEVKRHYNEMIKHPKSSPYNSFSIIRDFDRLTTDIDMYKHQVNFIFPKDKYGKEVFDKVVEALTPMTKTIVDVKIDNDGNKKEFKASIEANPALADDDKTYTLTVNEEFETDAELLFAQNGIDIDDCTYPISPKYAKLIENMQKEFSTEGKQLVFTEEKSQHIKIMRILVHHLPITAENVAIINAEEATGEKLGKISDAYNSGKIRLIIANRKAEVGVNLQKKTTAIHHLTLPWVPASLEQRNGRGVRQGNVVDSVHVYYYYGKGSFDRYRKNLLEQKSKWLDALLNSEENAVEFQGNDANEALERLNFNSDEEFAAYKAKQKEDAAKKQQDMVDTSARTKLKNVAMMTAKIKQFEELQALDKKAQEIAPADWQLFKSDPSSFTENQYKWGQLYSRVFNYDSFVTAKDKVRTLKKLTEKIETYKKALATGQNQLNALAKSGKLPFDAALINNPESVIVTPAAVYNKGDIFKFPDDFAEVGGYQVKLTGMDASNGDTLLSLTEEWLHTRKSKIDAGHSVTIKSLEGNRGRRLAMAALDLKYLIPQPEVTAELAKIQSCLHTTDTGATTISYEDFVSFKYDLLKRSCSFGNLYVTGDAVIYQERNWGPYEFRLNQTEGLDAYHVCHPENEYRFEDDLFKSIKAYGADKAKDTPAVNKVLTKLLGAGWEAKFVTKEKAEALAKKWDDFFNLFGSYGDRTNELDEQLETIKKNVEDGHPLPHGNVRTMLKLSMFGPDAKHSSEIMKAYDELCAEYK